MMLNLDRYKDPLDPGYSWPVKFSQPSELGGREAVEFLAHFRFVEQSRIDAIGRQLRGEAGAGEAPSDESLVREVLIGWSGIVDASEREVPFSPSALSSVLDVPGARTAIVRAWFESLRDGEVGN